MKTTRILLPLIALCLSMSVQAGDVFSIKTTTGRTYHQCRVIKAYPDCLNFSHAQGVARIPFTQLDQSVRTRFAFDAKAAAAHQQKVSAEWKAEQTAIAQRRAQEVIRRQEQRVASGGGVVHAGAGLGTCATDDSFPLSVYGLDGLVTQPLGHRSYWNGGRQGYSGQRGGSPLQYGPHYFGPVRPQLQFGGTVSPQRVVPCPVVPRPISQGTGATFRLHGSAVAPH